jgi:hypothetical protein
LQKCCYGNIACDITFEASEQWQMREKCFSGMWLNVNFVMKYLGDEIIEFVILLERSSSKLCF